MIENIERNSLLAKTIINGVMICQTGLHVGTGGYTSEIGGIDSPVVKNPVTSIPYVPGSSFKGKMRSLIERARPDLKLKKTPGKQTRIHWCDTREDALKCDVCRLFGYLPMGSNKGESEQIPSPLIVRDMDMTNHEYVAEHIISPLQYTEWKSENALDRVSAAANPRQIERVPALSTFWVEIVYDVTDFNRDYMKKDLVTLGEAMALIEDSAMGGHGSRGYGKVNFQITGITVRNIGFYSAGQTGTSQEKLLYSSKKSNKQDWDGFPVEAKEGLTLTEFQENLNSYYDQINTFLNQ